MVFDSLLSSHDAIVFFDTETTGLYPKRDRIIEIAAVRVEKKEAVKVTEVMNAYIRLPENKSIPEKITELTGIKDSDLLEHGVSEEEAAAAFAEIIAGEHVVLAAHNAQFDLSFVRYFLRGKTFGKLDFLDTLTVFRDRHAYPHKLSDAIAAYGIEDVQNSHSAADDVIALTAVARAMDAERNDLDKYLNIFGFLARFGKPEPAIAGVTYLPQSNGNVMVPEEHTLPTRVGK
ncbi:MAG: 3'-5' exonuclease [Oscillospiraceae bacterium]